MNSAIVLLGSPNNDDGSLSEIAISRCDHALTVFDAKRSHKLLCTGGFGDHFNRTNIAHAEYLRNYMIKKGVPKQAFLENALSRYTYEDATLSQRILKQARIYHIILVTSDFHMPRASYVFKSVLTNCSIEISSADSFALPANKLSQLVAHEAAAMKREQRNILAEKSNLIP
ncbi:YdcF family protein [Pseudoalteromonas aurantia]|uniref:DUF218 domain-containing protein n=1 Tax=Pseudoalteromonas aurantia 208 TaxID=1314867 RepID=A0ABR9EB46_9GAMM|nr:YdcF family protein [Pseudoalteromonas aurantia]MBE0368196.1 hypothetical protein [Pseudoalteromonas aurantia 208]